MRTWHWKLTEYYNEIGRLSDSVYFYQTVFSARKQMKKGDWSYEI
nr:hypothetical protein [Bacillus licheniformis]